MQKAEDTEDNLGGDDLPEDLPMSRRDPSRFELTVNSVSHLLFLKTNRDGDASSFSND